MATTETRFAPTRTTIAVRVGGIAVPIFMSSVLTLLTPVVNTATIGHRQPASLYVLALVLPVILLQNSVSESLRVSAVAFSSQASGNGDLATFRRRLQAVITIGVLANLGIALVFLAGHGLFMRLYSVPAESRALTFQFVQLNVLTVALLTVSITMMSSLYGFGQVRQVTIVTIASLCANVLLVLVLVESFGVFSLPAATTVTAGATIAWAATRLARLSVLPRPDRDLWSALRKSWREITRISLPVCISFLVIFFNGLIFTHLLAGFTSADVAGFGVAYRIQSLVMMPAIALGIGLAINVNRAVAAGRPEPVRAFVSTTLMIGGALYALLSVVIVVGRPVVTGWVTSEPMVANAAGTYLLYLAPAYLAAGPLLTMLIFLEETGNGFRALTFNISMVIAQLGLAFYLAHAFDSLPLVYLGIATSHLAAIGFIVHELLRIRRIGGRISMINRN